MFLTDLSGRSHLLWVSSLDSVAWCTDEQGSLRNDGALRCERPLRLTQAPMPSSLHEELWQRLGNILCGVVVGWLFKLIIS